MGDPEQICMIEHFAAFESTLKLVTATLAFATAILALRKAQRQAQEPKSESTPGSGGLLARASRRGLPFLALAGLLLIVGGLATYAFLWRPPSDSLSRALERRDSKIFYGSTTSSYEVARVLADRDRLIQETNLTVEWTNASKSLDFLAVSGTVLIHQWSTVDALLRRGVAVRVLLLDPETDRGAYDSAIKAAGADPADGRKGVEATLSQLEFIRSRWDARPEQYKGSLEVRLLAPPMFYSAWLRDRGSETAVVHLSPILFDEAGGGPSIRLGLDASKTRHVVEKDFEAAWRRGRPAMRRP